MSCVDAEDEIDREIAEADDRYEVARTDEGWGVWDRREPSSGPLAMYPVGDAGFEAAYEYFRRLNRAGRWDSVRWRVQSVSFWTSGVAGVIWALTGAVSDRRSLPVSGGL